MHYFFVSKKAHLADDMRIVILKIPFTTLMSCEHSVYICVCVDDIAPTMDHGPAIPTI